MLDYTGLDLRVIGRCFFTIFFAEHLSKLATSLRSAMCAPFPLTYLLSFWITIYAKRKGKKGKNRDHE